MAGKDKTFKVTANGLVFTFPENIIDTIDFVNKSPGEFHLIKHHRSVIVKILESDTSGKKQKVEVEGETFDIEVKDELDQMLETMGYNFASGKHIKEIKAPMPGLVLSIAVKEGQEISEGDRVLILEAMKMENSITVHANARIKRIAVTAGQAVEKGQVLAELE
ncbi:MAG: biotin/lipoyl-binding protein [Chitinophagaceae bacterium]|nr:biotin/lipoyl-binding protein [Chitinophagaceae bacterium]